MNAKTKALIERNRQQVIDAERDKAAREQCEQYLMALDSRVVKKRQHKKSMGCGLTVQDMTEYAEARVGLIDLEKRGYAQYLKTAAFDMYGWSWLRSKALRELIDEFQYVHPANAEPVTKRVAGESVPPPATTRHTTGEVRYKSYRFEQPLDESLPPRHIRAIFTTGDLDRDGEVLDPKGMQWENFAGNPRLLLDHDPKQYVGRVHEIDETDEGWVMVAEVLDEAAWRAVLTGELSTVSVGFNPIESHQEQDEQFNATTVHDRWELLEISLVGIPANGRAKITGIGVPNQSSAAA